MNPLELAREWLRSDSGTAILTGAVWFVGGWIVARLISAAVARVLTSRATAQRVFLSRRILFYSIGALTTLISLRSAGIDVGVLLGAAGVLTVALGFASQTSASNIISGLFLIGERPFVVGDAIRVGATEGQVLDVGWLSVRIRTWDNTLVRIPNETLIRAEIQNLTRFPIRRIDLSFDIAYVERFERVEEVLLALAAELAFCLETPKPVVRLDDFGANGVRVSFLVWASSSSFVDHRTRLRAATKQALQDAGIEIPFPQLVIHRREPREEAAASSLDVVGPT